MYLPYSGPSDNKWDDYYDYLFVDIGIRLTKNITQNLGFDILKFKVGGGDRVLSDSNLSGYGNYVEWFDNLNIQILTGMKFSTNRFGQKKHTYFYTSLRAGIGLIDSSWGYYYFDDNTQNNNYVSEFYELCINSTAFTTEIDIGIHFKYFFLGVTANNFFFKPDVYFISPGFWDINKTVHKPFIGVRFGLDFGRHESY